MLSQKNNSCTLCVPMFWVRWKTKSAESGVWKMRSVENAECGKCGVWKMRSVENEECGKKNYNKNSVLPG